MHQQHAASLLRHVWQLTDASASDPESLSAVAAKALPVALALGISADRSSYDLPQGRATNSHHLHACSMYRPYLTCRTMAKGVFVPGYFAATVSPSWADHFVRFSISQQNLPPVADDLLRRLEGKACSAGPARELSSLVSIHP